MQDYFSRAVLDSELQLPSEVKKTLSLDEGQRFNIYRNNVTVGLIDALLVRFPVINLMLGDEFFKAMAHLYIKISPPISPLMMFYGDGFADFIEQFDPAKEWPYLADIARIEAAITHSCHAADTDAMSGEDLAKVTPDALPQLSLTLHPSIRLISSPYPVASLWQAHQKDAADLDDIVWTREDALVSRLHDQVQVFVMPKGGFLFLQTISKGACLEEAFEQANAQEPSFDMSNFLIFALKTGCFSV